MRRRKPGEDELRRLVRDALPDDLPPDLAGPLRESLRPAWRRAVRAESPAAVRPELGWGPPALLPAAAVVMIVAGLFLQVAAPPRVLAESLALRKTASVVALRLGQAVAMRCVVETADPGGAARIYRIEWRSAQGTRVRTEDAAGALLDTLQLPSEGARPLGLAAPSAENVSSGLPGPARALFSPARVAALLEGRWQAESRTASSPRDGGAFVVSGADGYGTLRVALDAVTSLPVSIESTDASGAGAFRSRCEWSFAQPGPSLARGGSRAAFRP
jgi:hypothetical protein